MKISMNVLLLCLTAVLIAAMFRSPWPLPVTQDLSQVSTAAASQDASSAESSGGRDAEEMRSERDVLPPRSWELEYELPEKRLPPVTAERMKVCLEVADDLDPNLASRLRVMHEQDPKRVSMKLQELRRLRSLAELKIRDPHLYKLRLIAHQTDANVLRLAREVQEARREGEADKAKDLEQQLLSQVRLQIAFHFKAREEYLCELKDYVAELEAQLEEERKYLDRMEEIRMRELLGGPQVQNVAPDAR